VVPGTFQSDERKRQTRGETLVERNVNASPDGHRAAKKIVLNMDNIKYIGGEVSAMSFTRRLGSLSATPVLMAIL
jgi:hypothetical protein